MGVGGIVYLFTLSPTLTGGILIGIPVIIMPIVLPGRRLQIILRTSQDRVADIGATNHAQLGAMKLVQALGKEALKLDHFGSAVESNFDNMRRPTSCSSLHTAPVIGLILRGNT